MFGRFVDALVYVIVRLLICVIQVFRIETCQSLAHGLAFVACDVIRFRHKVIDDNLKHVYPNWTPDQRRDLSRSMWKHLILMVCEIAHVPRKLHNTNYRKYVTFQGKREVMKYLLDPRPTVLVTGHFGNFEIGGYLLGMLGFPTYTIARPLDNAFLDRFVNRFRGSKGQHIVARDGSAQLVDRVLSSGGKLAILGDQHAGAKGCWVEFLGRPASCHKAPAVFTLISGAPQLVLYSRRLQEPLCFEVGSAGVIDPLHLPESITGVKQLTEWYNARLEEIIREDPEQYWWVHRRWKGKPPARRRAQAA